MSSALGEEKFSSGSGTTTICLPFGRTTT
jgi:hypothetical protein